MRLCGSDLEAGGICFSPVSLSTGECPKADTHVMAPCEPLRLVTSEPIEESESLAV